MARPHASDMLDHTDRRGFMKVGAAVLIAAIWGSSAHRAKAESN
jgi:hypothetical protein